jgi:hypothetical protein
MTDPDAQRRREASNRAIAYFFAGLMIVAGVLIAGASGLCIMAFSGPGGIAELAWAIGGLPLFGGVAMVVGGIVIIATHTRRPPPPRPTLAATFSQDKPDE